MEKEVSDSSSVVRAVDRQSEDLGSNPSAAESVFFPQKDIEFFKFEFNLHLFAIEEFEIVYEVSYLIRDL